MTSTPVAKSSLARTATTKYRSPLFWLWAASFGAYLYMTAVPVDAWSQLQLAWGLIVVMYFFRHSSYWPIRMTFLFTGVFITLRYFFWRTFYTLEYNDPISFPIAILLYMAEIYGVTVFLLGVFVNICPKYREPEPLVGPPEQWPTVDIFIPTYNEDSNLLRNTIIAARHIKYPESRFKVYVLDDGGTVQKRTQKDRAKAAEAIQRHEELQELCAKTGAVYVTREKNFNAKAGNINSALKQVRGELVVILDADHIPTVDFLDKTVGLFQQDPKLFLVQTPHFFLNPDPLERNLDTFEQMPSENEMFYCVIQPGLDFWNAAFFCGSAAVLRRSCLDLVGGISGQTITEDAETALTIHSLGYHSAYIRYPLIAGLSPETFSGFIVQRVRWAQGMVQIFLLKNPLLQPGLSIAQRLCYFNSCFFWFFGFSRLVFALAPCAFLMFGLKIYHANVVEFLAFALPHVISSMIISDGLYGKVRWSFISELYELIQCVFTVPATIKVFLNPLAPKFAVTPKGEQLESGFISSLAPPFYFLFALTILSMMAGLVRMYYEPLERGITLIVLAWSVLNLIMVCATLGVVLERKQRRAYPRVTAKGDTEIEIEGKTFSGFLDNVSAGGASLGITGVDLKVWFREKLGSKIRFDYRIPLVDKIGNFHGILRNVRIGRGVIYLGLEFVHESQAEVEAKVALVFGDSQRWQSFMDNRGTRRGIKSNLLFLFQTGFIAAVAHFLALAKQMLNSLKNRIRKAYEFLFQIPKRIG